jgi:hypothetical protein
MSCPRDRASAQRRPGRPRHSSSHQIGAAFAAWAAGFVRTETSNSMSAFISAGLICMMAAAMVPFIGTGREPRKRVDLGPAVTTVVD